MVLDLGSGGDIDALLSAKRVSPGGKAYGLDMTDEMLELARANARQAGAESVEFLKGQIESIPSPENSVDVIISNCLHQGSTTLEGDHHYSSRARETSFRRTWACIHCASSTLQSRRALALS